MQINVLRGSSPVCFAWLAEPGLQLAGEGGEMQRGRFDRVGGVAAAPEDDAEAEQAAEHEGGAGQDPREAERRDDHADQIKRRLRDLDPGDAVGGVRDQAQRGFPLLATVALRSRPVN